VDPGEYDRVFRLESRHFWYRGLHALLLRSLERYAPTGVALRILDAGCGTGGLMGRLGGRGAVTGLDLSPRALSYAAARGERQLVRGNVEQLPFREASFDLVVSADVLYHRAVVDDEAALAELRRVCRPGGFVFLNLPAHAWLAADHDRAIHTARRYARRDLRRLAARTGLDVVRLSYFNCLLFPLAAAVRLATRRGQPRSDLRPLPRPLDALLVRVLEAEGRLLLRVPLPWGLSLFAVLRRAPRPTESVARARAFGLGGSARSGNAR